MFRVMIVEDEKLVRFGLRNSIDWGKYHMEVVADAADGLSALNLYYELKPDIIITDIKMPVMDGIELIKKIRLTDQETRIIILTCFEEFEFIHEGLKSGISGYILKLTMTDEEIDSVLMKVYNDLQKKEDKRLVSKVTTMASEAVRERVFKDYIFYGIYKENDFIKQLESIGIHLNPQRLLLGIMHINHYEKLKSRFQDENGQLVKFSLINVFNEVMDGCSGVYFRYDDTRYVFIFYSNNDTGESKLLSDAVHVIEKLKRSMDSLLDISVSFGMSSVKTGYAALQGMVEECMKSLESNFLYGVGIYGFHEGKPQEKVFKEKIDLLLSLPECLGQSETSMFMQKYKAKIHRILNERPVSKSKMQLAFSNLISWISNELCFTGNNDDIIIRYSTSLINSESVYEIIDILRDFFSEIKNVVNNKQIMNPDILRAIEYMKLNYEKPLSLQNLSDFVNLSVSYLSSLFKKELNVNFIDYLNRIRIEKAKELLVKTCLKTYEIAESVGFSDNTYFSKAFKKYVGMSPVEFRKKWDMDPEGIKHEN